MAAKAGPVKLVGLDDLQRDLRRVSPEFEQRIEGDGLRSVEERAAADASARAVRRTGEYASSIRRMPEGGVGSLLKQAGVLHWGGVIRPRGAEISFPRRPVISEAMERNAPAIVDRVGDLVDEAARDAGWDR
jgi:hypothetical protein